MVLDSAISEIAAYFAAHPEIIAYLIVAYESLTNVFRPSLSVIIRFLWWCGVLPRFKTSALIQDYTYGGGYDTTTLNMIVRNPWLGGKRVKVDAELRVYALTDSLERIKPPLNTYDLVWTTGRENPSQIELGRDKEATLQMLRYEKASRKVVVPVGPPPQPTRVIEHGRYDFEVVLSYDDSSRKTQIGKLEIPALKKMTSDGIQIVDTRRRTGLS